MKFYGQFDPPLDQVLYESFFTDDKYQGNGLCIEYGAGNGVDLSTTKFFNETLRWDSVNVEPHPDLFAGLIANRKKSLNLHCALGSSPVQAVLKYSRNFKDRAHLTTDTSDKRFQYSRVNVLDYVSLIYEYEIEHVDLMVIDVVGHEMKVLQGMHGADVLPGILCVAVDRFNKQDRRKASAILTEMGYEFVKRPRVNALFKHKESYRG